MKKILAVIALIMVFAVSSFAGIEISVFGGYTTVAMTKVNKEIDDMAALYTALPGITLTKNNITQGFIVGADIGFSPIPGLSIGPRIEMLLGANGLVEVKQDATGDFIKTEFSGTLIPILGGASYMISIPGSSFSLGAGAYLGYGLANAGSKVSFKVGTFSSSQEVKMDGGCFAADIVAKAKLGISSMMSVGLQLGYRLANVAQMKYSEDNASAGVVKGEVVKDTAGDDIPFDFSGFIAGLDFGFAF